jgi:8-oxo-dGTP diphosphatase
MINRGVDSSDQTDTRPFTEVAVGLVFDAQGRVLMGQRPAGKAYAGWWEFPGGKIEPGETVDAALARELEEELGLRIAVSFPWVLREHSYEHARVRLHFRRVFEFSGQPEAREGQAFAWCNAQAIEVEPLLPAALPLLPWLALPRTLVLEQLKNDPALRVVRACDLDCQGPPSPDTRMVVRCLSLDDISRAQAGQVDAILLEPEAGSLVSSLLERVSAPAFIHESQVAGFMASFGQTIDEPEVHQMVQGVWREA